jgi:hypothetical protein
MKKRIFKTVSLAENLVNGPRFSMPQFFNYIESEASHELSDAIGRDQRDK